jgi:FkbM family methyltransferase
VTVASRVSGLFRHVGVDVLRFDPARHPALARAGLLARVGVDVLLDVGANDGSFGVELRRHGYRGRIVSFEPQADAFGRLERRAADDPDWTCRRVALGSSAGEGVLNVSENSSSSSLLGIAAAHVQSAPESAYVGVEDVRVTRLDDVATALLRPEDRVAIKVDTQGYELEVLRGGQETLGRAALVDCEVSLLPLYDSAPLLEDVVGFLRERGFRPVWLVPAFVDPSSGDVLQVDCAFLREGGS